MQEKCKDMQGQWFQDIMIYHVKFEGTNKIYYYYCHYYVFIPVLKKS